MIPIILCAAVAIGILVYMMMTAHPSARPGNNVRRHPRLPVFIDVHIHTENDTHSTQSQNISQGGMSLRGQAPVKVSQPVQLSFTLPEQESVSIPAVITHKQGEQIGVRFDPTHHRRLVIEKWVKQTLAESKAAAKAGQ